MNMHFVGNGGFALTPDHTPKGRSASPSGRGETSLAVRQFAELVRGERVVQAPRNEWRTVSVAAVEFYCLWCKDVRVFDVIEGEVERGRYWMRICRCCGAAGEKLKSEEGGVDG